MSLLSLIEFAAGEFAGFEFASEERGLPVLTDLSVTGAAAFSLESGAVAQVILTATGQGNADFAAQTVINTVYAAASSGILLPIATTVIGVDLATTGSGIVSWEAGEKRGVSFDMQGSSAADFPAFDGIEFGIAGSASVLFYTSVIANTGLSVTTAAAASFPTQHVAYAGFACAGTTVLAWRNDALIDTSFSTAAIATVTFAARGIATSLLEGIAGVGSFTPRMQAVVPATLQAAGAGSFSIPAQMLRQSTLTIAGVVVPVWATVVLRETTLTAQGSALVDLRPGSPIVTNLTPAYDRVLRPYEQRSAVWK